MWFYELPWLLRSALYCLAAIIISVPFLFLGYVGVTFIGLYKIAKAEAIIRRLEKERAEAVKVGDTEKLIKIIEAIERRRAQAAL